MWGNWCLRDFFIKKLASVSVPQFLTVVLQLFSRKDTFLCSLEQELFLDLGDLAFFPAKLEKKLKLAHTCVSRILRAFFPTLIRLSFFLKKNALFSLFLFTGQAARFGVRENDKVRHSPNTQFDAIFKINK